MDKVEILSAVVTCLCTLLSIGLSLYIGLARYLITQEKAVFTDKIRAHEDNAKRDREELEKVRTRCEQLEKQQGLQAQLSEHQRTQLERTQEIVEQIQKEMLTKGDHDRSMQTVLDAIKASRPSSANMPAAPRGKR